MDAPTKEQTEYAIKVLREAAAECHKLANESALMSHKSDMVAAMKCQGAVQLLIKREQGRFAD